MAGSIENGMWGRDSSSTAESTIRPTLLAYYYSGASSAPRDETRVRRGPWAVARCTTRQGRMPRTNRALMEKVFFML